MTIRAFAKICYCGAEFDTPNPRLKFCSEACRKVRKHKRMRHTGYISKRNRHHVAEARAA